MTKMNETKANSENEICSCQKHKWDQRQYWKRHVLLWQAWMRRKPILKMICAPVTSMNETKANIENDMCSCDKHEWDESQYWKWYVLLWQAWMRRKPILKMISERLGYRERELRGFCSILLVPRGLAPPESLACQGILSNLIWQELQGR